MRFTGDGDRARLAVSGRMPRAHGATKAVLRRLADAGVVVEVTDPAGRLLARAGAVRPSPVGRLLAGSPAIRPTARGVLAGIRPSRRAP